MNKVYLVIETHWGHSTTILYICKSEAIAQAKLDEFRDRFHSALKPNLHIEVWEVEG